MIDPIAPVDLAGRKLLSVANVQTQGAERMSFAEVLSKGIETTTNKLVEADKMVAQFAVDDSIPLHHVTYALEEARLSFELMIQVRNKMLDATQQLMNMQV